MADPHVILAPIVEPPLPPVPAAPPAPVAALPLLLALLALTLVVAAAFWWWRRGEAARSLHRIARNADVQQGAQRLARWQAMHWPAAPQAWRQVLDRLRFGPSDDAAAATLQELCAAAGHAWRQR